MSFKTLFLSLLTGLSLSASAAEFEMNIGSLAPKGTPWMDTLETMEMNIESQSGGRINVILRPPGVMSEVEMVRETRSGQRLQACGVTTAALAEGGNIPQLQLVELPYLFKNNAEADYVLDEVLWEPISTAMARRGFILTIWSENGWRSFATKGRPIRTPDDLTGFKMRSQVSDVHMAMYKTYGAQAVQKPMTEVLTALQSGIVDGLDNTPLYLMTGGLAEPLDYFTTTNHIYQPAAIVVSRKWFETLPDDLKAIVMANKSLAVSGRKAIRTESDALRALLSEQVEIIELNDEQRAAFETKARTMHAGFVANIDGGTELLATINAALDAKRAQ